MQSRADQPFASPLASSGEASAFDLVLVGGGLQNALIVLATLHHRPETKIALVEQEDHLGGNHTWSFLEHTLSVSVRKWLEPLVSFRWPAHTVRFPGLHRSFSEPYASILAGDLHTVIATKLDETPGCRLFLSTRVTGLDEHTVRIADQHPLTGLQVVYSPGPRETHGFHCGFQKFVGLELVLSTPHDLQTPVLMDANVSQTDGFRFFYLLPFTPHRVLVEDTYFSPDPGLDEQRIAGEVLTEARRRGFVVADIVRREKGVLEMGWKDDRAEEKSSVLVGGVRGGFFHPGTGYSIPVASQLAETVACAVGQPGFWEAIAKLRQEIAHKNRYFFFLNWMLFRLSKPSARRNIMQRFYAQMAPDTILRFYGHDLSTGDKLRLLFKRPPSLRQFRLPGTKNPPTTSTPHGAA
jgi:lycopene beta-cyclase